MNKHHKSAKGQSVLEVLIAATLIAIAFISLLSLNNHSIRTSGYSRNQTTATTYTTQAVDWLRNQRTLWGWETIADKFNTDAGVSATATYCLLSLPTTIAEFTALLPGDCDTTDVITGTIYSRTITVDTSDISNKSLKVKVNTTWQDNTNPSALVEITLDKTQ